MAHGQPTERALANLTLYQRDHLPVHQCQEHMYNLPDDLILLSPGENQERVLCPNKGCMLPVFIPQRAKWVETLRVERGKHQLDQKPPEGYTRNDPSDVWWHKRCSNCGRWHHTTDICDQDHLFQKCVLCHKFRHDIDT